MAVFPLTTDWSDPITLQAGDIVQNQTAYPVAICPGVADDSNRLLLPAYSGALQVDDAVTIVARATGSGGGSLTVVRGF